MEAIRRVRAAARALLRGERRYSAEREYRVWANRRLEGRVAVVTGGCGAIGSAICRRLALEGATVLAAGRSRGSFDARFGKGAEDIGYLPLDVSDERSVEAAFLGLGGRLDILVNCAGGSPRERCAPLAEQSVEVIDEMLGVNLRGSLLCSRAAAGIMAARGSGCIVNVSSVIGERGKASFTDYCAAKAGITGYTRSLALELGGRGVRVNCVSPGFIQRGEFSQGQLEYNLRSNCLGRVGCAEDVASVVAFLASDEASFVTGQNLCVDGGRSLGLMGDWTTSV